MLHAFLKLKTRFPFKCYVGTPYFAWPNITWHQVFKRPSTVQSTRENSLYKWLAVTLICCLTGSLALLTWKLKQTYSNTSHCNYPKMQMLLWVNVLKCILSDNWTIKTIFNTWVSLSIFDASSSSVSPSALGTFEAGTGSFSGIVFTAEGLHKS